ncbi:MAG TPA: energy transducer TonB [Terriglobales bacterium]|nr:energy transducer TonB [Terriglobales bacterium]
MGCSFVLQMGFIAALIAVSMLTEQVVIRKRPVSEYIPLTAPMAEVRQPELKRIRPTTTPLPVAIKAPPPKLLAKLSVPAPRKPEPAPVVPPPAPVKTEEFVSLPQQQVVRPQAPRFVQTGMFTAESTPKVNEVQPEQKVQTGSFSTGSSATPTSNLPPQKVQTGGFGDPNGVLASNNGKTGKVQMAQLGGFDLPSGSGVGNGSGGASGARAVVSSAGFGNGVATSTPGKGNGHGRQVAPSAGFSDQSSSTPTQPVKRVALKEPPLSGVEILAKPTPEYTDEARRLRIEGEVLLDVVFNADGQLQVVRVVRGLGHGLDEAAVRAAERVRFKPALREGKAVDSKATLHIVFQLA